MYIKKGRLRSCFFAGLLLILCACSDASESGPLLSGADGSGVTVTVSFLQEDGAVLRDSAVRLSQGEDSVVLPLNASGEASLSGIPRNGTFALTVLDQQERSQGAMSLTFTEGAIIDAVTDESGNGYVTLRSDTEEIALTFLLKASGTMQCALRLG